MIIPNILHDNNITKKKKLFNSDSSTSIIMSMQLSIIKPS